MPKSAKTLLMLALGALAACFMAGSAFCSSTKEPEYFPMKVGNFWRYKVSMTGTGPYWMDFRVTGREKVGKLHPFRVEIFDTRSRIKTVEFYAPSKEGIRMAGTVDQETGKTVPAREPGLYLPIAAKAGTSWVSEKGDDPEKPIETKKIIGIEPVAVPAGNFRALRVSGEKRLGTDSRLKFNIWYAPGVGVVKMTIETPAIRQVQELETYGFSLL